MRYGLLTTLAILAVFGVACVASWFLWVEFIKLAVS